MRGFLKLEQAPEGKRIIVCGGRTYEDRDRLFEALDLLRPVEIAQGEAAGADSLARAWAKARGIPCARFPAFWRLEGRSAGPKRNRRMFSIFEPDGTVAFPGGAGTADMSNVTLDGGAWLVRIWEGRSPPPSA